MASGAAYFEAEAWIREHGLPAHFPGHLFEKLKLPVGTRKTGEEAHHEFDAVSEDKSVVASVKASSGLTTGGNRPAAKIRDSYAELHFLSLVDAPRRVLVLTDPEFYRIFVSDSDGRLPGGVELLHLPLPSPIQDRVRAARVEDAK